MGRKKSGKARKKVHAAKERDPITVSADNEWSQYEAPEVKNAPHSFIIHRGKVGRHMKELVKDFRLVMEPYTASKLKMKKGNVLRDCVSIASYFHVTHLCAFSLSKVSPYLKICRLPRGPSLSFRVLNYTLARDVLANLRKQVTYAKQFEMHPLLIMNNFSSEEKHLELISTTFQNMFPSININKIKIKEIRRVLLLNYNEEDDTIDMRHYTVTYRPVGVSKSMKKLLAGNHGKIPNLSRCQDISEFLKKEDEAASDSEFEDTAETVNLSQHLSARGTKGVDEVAVRLVELGPRMKLQLIKIEEGLLDGEVLYHKLMDKTDEEKLEIRKVRVQKTALKAKRRKIQEENVERKRQEKEKHKQRCLAGMMGMQRKGKAGASNSMDIDSDDDDAAWYRKEVGEEPDEEMTFG